MRAKRRTESPSRRPRPRRAWLALLFCAALAGCGSHAETRAGTAGGASVLAPAALGRSTAIGMDPHAPLYRSGVAATSEAEPAAAAAAVLRQGGNAVDAAAAAAFVLNVVEPQSSGLGGGFFMLVHLAAEGRTVVVDARETAPAAASPDMFLDDEGRPPPFALVSTAGVAVGVPGMLRGIETALARWGTRPLAEALAPAIALAEGGIVVNERLARASAEPRLQTDCDGDPANSAYDRARAVFRPGDDDAASCGAPLAAGMRLAQPELARTLRAIAADGPQAFYDCAHPAGIARGIVTTQAAAPQALGPRGAGRMTCDDLAGYQPVIREPVEGRYRGYLVRSTPPPSSGGLALLQMLKMLERFPLHDEARGFGPGAAGTLTVMQEAMRLAFADRALWMGDTDALPGLPVAALLDDAYLSLRAASCPDPDPADAFYCITAGARLSGVRAGDPRPFAAGLGGPPFAGGDIVAAGREEEGRETTHLSVADRWGNVVSLTASIEAKWGTGLMVPGAGFLLNNQLTDFNLQPQRRGRPEDADFDPGANDAAPGKRPRSSMAPSIVFLEGPGAGQPVAAFGSPGGSGIINTLLTVSLNLIDHRLPAAAAIERPRLSLTRAADDATTAIEAGFDPVVLQRLAERGYRFAAPEPIGAVQAVIIEPATGAAQGAADPRRYGSVAGLP